MIAKLSLALSFGFCLSFLELGPMTELSPAASNSQMRAIRGADTWEDTSDFIAWHFFIVSIVTASENSYLELYVDKRMKLEDFWQGKPELRRKAITLLIEELVLAQHRMKVFENRFLELMKRQQEGILQLTEEEYKQRRQEIRQNQVNSLMKTCNSIRDGLLKLDVQSGPKIWNAIIDYVETEINYGNASSTDDTPRDQTLDEVWDTFKVKKIE